MKKSKAGVLQSTILILVSALLGLSLGQREIETPEVVVQQEPGVVFTVDASGQTVPTANLLDMIYECNRAAALITDVDGDGKEDFRVFGFDFVDAEAYALRGTRSFSLATQQAQTRAMGSATEYLFGVASYTTRFLEDLESSSDTATSTGSPLGDDRERLRSLSLTTRETFRQVFSTGSSGFLKGGHPSGTKFVSLGGDNGYCIIVRYDIPLNQTGPVPGFANDNTNPGTGSGSEEEDTYPPLPPGESGDF